MNRTTNSNRLNDNGQNEMQIANHAIKQRRIANPSQRRKYLLIAAMMLGMVLPANAADYVFEYNGGYLAVDNSGNVIYTTTLSPQCVWTCVSSTTYLTATTLSTTSRYLYTTDGNGTRRWLIGSTTNGAAITTSENAPGTAYWRNNNNRLYYRDGNDFYAYYRENTWRTSRRNNGTTYGVNAYMSGNNNGTDYRSTTYQVTVSTTASLSTNPTINGADVLTATGNSTYTATGAAYRIGYTNYQFNNNANHYVDVNGNSFTGTPANATLTNTWSLDDNSYATVNNSGVVNVSSLPEYDITLTLTVTATATGGTPAAPANTTLTATKEITIQGTKPSAPIISVSGNIVTLSTDAAGSTTIRYTLNGIDPTTSTGTVYGSAIDLSSSANSPVTIKAITVRNGNASSVTEQSVRLTLPEPVITANASAGTATITCANAGATIYYTTDGTTPSATNGTEYTGQLSGLPLMTNLQAIAVRDGWNDSPVASVTLTLPSGVSGTTVTLFDYEPHSWSYYSDADCPIRSLNPADVKITYYGDGIMMMNNNNYTASSVENTDYITSSGTNYTGGAKVNVGGENENTFIYYKTLERGDATETAWTYSSTNQTSAASRCPYTPIPNPFQVRPTYGSRGTTNANDFTGWRGFQCWRLKSVSGGAVYSAASDGTALTVGAVINAETEIYFAPNAETGMTVDFEAVWARAYVVMASNGTENAIGDHSDLGYERNFIVLNTTNASYNFGGTSGKRITNIDRQVTVSNYMPDGTRGANTGSTIRGAANQYNITLGANTKFENVQFDMGNRTFSAAGHDLIIGRGCTGTVQNIYGDGSNGMDYSLRIESGTYTNFYALKYNGNYVTYSGINKIRTTLGCDYDRAKGSSNGGNDNLTITSIMYMGQRCCFSDPSNGIDGFFKCWVKSGNLLNGTITNGDGGEESFYLGTSGSQNQSQYIMPRYLYMEGGILAGIAGGLDDQSYTNASDFRVFVRMTGGYVRGCVYGAGSFARGAGIRKYVLTGGEIGGWVAAGCNGIGSSTTQANNGEMNGDSYMYIGGDIAIGYKNTTINSVEGGNVFGAGRGAPITNYNVGTVNNSNIVIADDGQIEKNVYGGGNYGFTINTATISILGGTVDGRVFGGANMTQGETSNIYMNDGLVKSGIYGGCNTQGNMSGDITIQVDGGTVGEGNAGNGIFGGGYGSGTSISGNVSVTLGTCAAGDATVYGDVYGGSALGTVNDASSDKTTVSLYNGTIHGGIYGGGYGPGGVAANVNGAVEVKVFGGSVLCSESDPQGEAGSGSVFGCNNAGGAPQSTVKVDIYKTDAAPGEGQYALHAVYGGGNKANYDGTPVVTIHGCDASIEYVYGGGNASDVEGTNVTIWGGTIGNAFGGGNGYSVTGNHTNQGAAHYNPGANITTEGTNLKIYGGTIGAAFGGSNQYGTINDGVQVTVDSRDESNEGRPACVDQYTTCPLSIGELYSGGNEAALISSRNPLDYITPNKIIVSLSCSANIGMLFGGAKAANYVGNINLVVDGGTYTKVFGGNNKGGTITGDVTVTFNGGSADEVYGGCNESGDITGNITVNIDSTNSTCPTRFYVENVYGGGNLAAYGGSPVVNIINGTVQENVYGGGYGSTAEVAGSPAVTVGVSNNEKRALVLGNVFGGGNAAPVSGDTDVKILYNSYIKGNVYGGGNKATVSGNTKVNIGN